MAGQLGGDPFEGLLVDHDVGDDLRAALARRVVGGGLAEDGVEGVEAALAVGAGQVGGGGGVALGGPGGGPVGLELGLDDPGEDGVELGALQRRAPAGQGPGPVEVLVELGVAVLMAALVAVPGAVLVDQAHPLTDHQIEGVVAVRLGLGHEGRLVGHHRSLDPGVGMGPGDAIDLAPTDGPGPECPARLGQVGQRLGRPGPSGGLGARQLGVVTDHHLGRSVPVHRMQPSPLDLGDQVHLGRVQPAGLGLQVDDHAPGLACGGRGEPSREQVVDVRGEATDRLHLRAVEHCFHDPIVRRGCDSEIGPKPCSDRETRVGSGSGQPAEAATRTVAPATRLVSGSAQPQVP